MSHKKTARITVISSGQESIEAIGKWHRRIKQQALKGITVDHYCVSQSPGVRNISAPFLPEPPSTLANSDLVIVALGVEAICPLPSILMQQVREHHLSLVVLLAGGSRYTMSDLQIPEEQVSIIRTAMSVGKAVEKLLQPFVSQGLVGVDINDFKMIAPAGSWGFMANATEAGEDAPYNAAKNALTVCQHVRMNRENTINLWVDMAGHTETFTIGDYSRVGEAVDEFAASARTVICSTSVFGSLPKDAFEVTVLMIEEVGAVESDLPKSGLICDLAC